MLRQLTDIAAKVEAGERLDREDGLRLFAEGDLLTLGYLANLVRERRSGDDTYYIINAHINYTNVCRNRCRFCAFSRDEGAPDAYLMTVEEILARAEDAVARLGVAGYEVSEFHIVGGLHPTAPFSYYLDMMAALSGRFPQAHLQAFTAVEIAHLAERGGLSVEECLAQLRAAGLGSLPGGGAEVFSPRVRDLLCPEKISGDDWRAVIRTAHQLGLRTNATMLYGHVETPAEVVDHLLALRDLQDETGGFLAFIPLAFHPAHTRMPELPGRLPYTTGCADLRMIATARLLLDNFPHIKVFWIMAGIKLAQVALSFGADDLDGTVDEERITHAAGAATPQSLTVTAIEQLIRDAGRTPVRRDTLYQRVGG